MKNDVCESEYVGALVALTYFSSMVGFTMKSDHMRR